METLDSNDADLVAKCLAGDRHAFGRIVVRYQSLICSLAYSAIGNLGQSEDLAQETFVDAWKQLSSLREPAKLRSWLCGIARNRVYDVVRSQAREPIHAAELLDAVSDFPAPGPLPSDQAISKEEEAILWRSMERIPDVYREPLILFYREHQSVERVAQALELSEDAVKQRLSRGRKLLHEQVLAFVEGALERTSPGKAFTFGVLAALPVFATSASAATVGAAAAKGSATAVSATIVTLFNALLGPVVGLLGAYVGVRTSIEATRTPRERQFVVSQTKIMIVVTLLFTALLFTYISVAIKYWKYHPVLFTVLGIAIPLTFLVFLLVRIVRYNREFRRIRDEERRYHPELFRDEAAGPVFTEYRSRWTFLGLPLVHVSAGTLAGQKVQPAVGWIAIGDRAYGILFAVGGLAVGAISMGGVSVGLLALGGVSIGLLAIGGFALGGLAMGGAAIGILAAGGFATAWIGATGGLAVAREFALGGLALARHANDQVARDYFAQHPWFDLAKGSNRNLIVSLCWLPMLLAALYWQAMRKLKKKHASRSA